MRIEGCTGVPQIQPRCPCETRHAKDCEDSRECRELLRETFSACVKRPQNDFAVLCATISCVAVSQRSLTTLEIEAACVLFLGLRDAVKSTNTSGEFAMRSAPRWQGISGSLFLVSEANFVKFSLPGMRQFLRTHHIRGIDVSDSTLARLCVARIGLEDQMRMYQQLKPRFATLLDATNAFSDYAHKYHQLHCQRADQQSIDVSQTISDIIDQK